MFNRSCLVKYFSFLGLKLSFVYLKILYLRTNLVQQLVKRVRDLWQSFAKSLHLVTLVIPMDHTLRADWRAQTSKAEVADKLVRMTLAGNAKKFLPLAKVGMSLLCSIKRTSPLFEIESACV
jgi:hypothetical protein